MEGYKKRYFLQLGKRPEQEVSMEEFIEAEQGCGFYPKRGCGPVATGGFGSGFIRGRVEYVKEEDI